MHFFTQPAPSWWSTLDWGNVPAWVSGMLTSVSVFIALLVLLRDRGEKRQKLADSLVIWSNSSGELKPGKTDDDDDAYEWYETVSALNTGIAPIPYVDLEVIYKRGGGGMILTLKDGQSSREWIVQPGELVSQKIHVTNPADIYVFILDAGGDRWVRPVDRKEYLSDRKWNRIQYGWIWKRAWRAFRFRKERHHVHHILDGASKRAEKGSG